MWPYMSRNLATQVLDLPEEDFLGESDLVFEFGSDPDFSRPRGRSCLQSNPMATGGPGASRRVQANRLDLSSPPYDSVDVGAWQARHLEKHLRRGRAGP